MKTLIKLDLLVYAIFSLVTFIKIKDTNFKDH